MKAVLALRVSTEGKGQDEGDQEAPLRDAARRLGWNVVGVVQTKESAWKEASAIAWEAEVRDELVKSSADVLMVWSLDRFTRRKPLAAMQAVAGLEEHLGVHFWSLQEPFLNTAAGTFREPLLALIAWLGETESAKKSHRVRKKHAAKAAHAEALGTKAKWGRGRIPTNVDRAAVWACKDRGLSVRGTEMEIGVPKSTVSRILQEPRPVPNVGLESDPSASKDGSAVPSEPEGQAGGAA